MRPLILVLLTFYWSTSVLAASIGEVSVTRDRHSFIAAADFIVDLPRVEVIRAFSEIDRMAELNPAILTSSAEVQADGTVRVSTVVSDCMALFCRKVAMVEDLNFEDQYSVQSTVVPELCDFQDGTTTWHFADAGEKTLVTYRSTFTPDFWLPPVLGPQAIRKSLIKQIQATSNNLEAYRSEN